MDIDFADLLMEVVHRRASDLHLSSSAHPTIRVRGRLTPLEEYPILSSSDTREIIYSILTGDQRQRLETNWQLDFAYSIPGHARFRVNAYYQRGAIGAAFRLIPFGLTSIDELGLPATVHEFTRKPRGFILVTGPTGSGKTVSLYTCLNILNQPGTNISTAEDPAEINLPGINQVNVNEKAGLTFAVALKAFLRQDPDVIMVGEIRDIETGEIAIKAAQTGHLVWSTLHTNDAPTTLTRLMNMGIAPFNIATSVMLITAQRLARRLCPTCKRPADIPKAALLRAGFTERDLDGSWQPYMHVGCDACKNTGYKGRTGISQVMPISEEINKMIMKNGNAIEIAAQAKREGVKDLRQSGLIKVRQGMTSLEEVEAVTNE